MVIKRAKRLVVGLIISCLVLSFFGICLGVDAKDYDSNLSSTTSIKVGDVLTPSDRVGNSSSYSNYFKVAYYEPNGKYISYDQGTLLNVRDSYLGYTSWEVISISKYYGYADYINVIPSNKIEIKNPTDVTVAEGEDASFEYNVNSDRQLHYMWYKEDLNDRKDFTLSAKYGIESINDYRVLANNDYSEFSVGIENAKKGFLEMDVSNINEYVYINFNVYTKEGSFLGYEEYYYAFSPGKISLPINFEGDLAIEIYLYNSYDTVFSNIKYVEDTSTFIDTKNSPVLPITPTTNSEFYKNGNKFYAIAKSDDSDNTFIKSTSAKLNIVPGSKTFETDDKKSSVELNKPANKDYVLKIFDITNKVDKDVFETIDNGLDLPEYKAINVFNVGMYDEDKLVDLGEGDYLLKVEKPSILNNYVNLRVSELDKDYKVINTEIPDEKNGVLSFKVNKLNNFAFSGIQVRNPVTSSPYFIGFIIFLIIALTTGYLEFYNKKVNSSKE